MQSISVADLRAGDTETVDIEVAAARVDPGTYPLFAGVQYRIDAESTDDEMTSMKPDETNDDEETEIVRTGGPTLLGIAVNESRSFDVTPVTDSVPVDGESVYEVQQERRQRKSVTGVVATVEAQPPLSSESPTAYVGTLESGDSETVRFGLESSTDAIETTTSVTITLAYDTDAGDRTNAEPVPVPVMIVDADEDTDANSVVPFITVARVRTRGDLVGPQALRGDPMRTYESRFGSDLGRIESGSPRPRLRKVHEHVLDGCLTDLHLEDGVLAQAVDQGVELSRENEPVRTVLSVDACDSRELERGRRWFFGQSNGGDGAAFSEDVLDGVEFDQSSVSDNSDAIADAANFASVCEEKKFVRPASRRSSSSS